MFLQTENKLYKLISKYVFPSPCGEMFLQTGSRMITIIFYVVSVPLRGDGSSNTKYRRHSCRPEIVSVPLRGDGSSNPASGNPLCARAPEAVCGAKVFCLFLVLTRPLKMPLKPDSIRCGAKSDQHCNADYASLYHNWHNLQSFHL